MALMIPPVPIVFTLSSFEYWPAIWKCSVTETYGGHFEHKMSWSHNKYYWQLCMFSLWCVDAITLFQNKSSRVSW